MGSGQATGRTGATVGSVGRWCAAEYPGAAEAVLTDIVDPVGPDFRYPGQAAGTEDVVDGIGGTQAELRHRQTFIALELAATGRRQFRRSHRLGRAGGRAGKHREGVAAVVADRLVRPVAQFAEYRGGAQYGAQAGTEHADVFGVDRVVGGRSGQRSGGDGAASLRCAAVVVGVVEAEIGLVQRLEHIVRGHPVLAGIAGPFGLSARDVAAGGQCLLGGAGASGENRGELAAFLDVVARAEEGPATVEHRGAEVVLPEAFHAQRIGQGQVETDHFHRQQAFLQLDAGAVEGGNVQRVDGVHAVLHEQRLTPAQYMLADFHPELTAVDVEILPDIGVEGLETLEPGQVLPARVVELGEVAIAGFQGMVVPVLEAHEGPLGAVLQIEFGQALEHRGDGVAFFEIEPVIVGVVSDAFALAADAEGVSLGHQFLIGIFH
ncbi:hypothetical protein D9M69_463890 [compost metagenome]